MKVPEWKRGRHGWLYPSLPLLRQEELEDLCRPRCDSTPLQIGVVKHFANGYGFISCEQAKKTHGTDVFVHHTEVREGDLEPGHQVSFVMEHTEQGLRATDVCLQGDSPDAACKGDAAELSAQEVTTEDTTPSWDADGDCMDLQAASAKSHLNRRIAEPARVQYSDIGHSPRAPLGAAASLPSQHASYDDLNTTRRNEGIFAYDKGTNSCSDEYTCSTSAQGISIHASGGSDSHGNAEHGEAEALHIREISVDKQDPVTFHRGPHDDTHYYDAAADAGGHECHYDCAAAYSGTTGRRLHTNIYVGNLDNQLSQQQLECDLREKCTRYGTINKMKVAKPTSCQRERQDAWALIDFTTALAARCAVTALQELGMTVSMARRELPLGP